MNVLTRRCGCGAVFALVHLRDRTQQCTACQRKAAARLEREEAARMIRAATRVERDKQQKAAQEFMRWATEKLAERERHALAAKTDKMHLCEGDFEQVGHCEMPLRTAFEPLLSAVEVEALKQWVVREWSCP